MHTCCINLQDVLLWWPGQLQDLQQYSFLELDGSPDLEWAQHQTLKINTFVLAPLAITITFDC